MNLRMQCVIKYTLSIPPYTQNHTLSKWLLSFCPRNFSFYIAANDVCITSCDRYFRKSVVICWISIENRRWLFGPLLYLLFKSWGTQTLQWGIYVCNWLPRRGVMVSQLVSLDEKRLNIVLDPNWFPPIFRPCPISKIRMLNAHLHLYFQNAFLCMRKPENLHNSMCCVTSKIVN